MNEPKEVWWFDRWFASRPVTGPYKIFGEKEHLWITYKGADKWHIPKEDAYFTKREAVVAHYKHNEEVVRRARQQLDERMRLLKKYYSEELHE
jgi:uncharacterized protein YbcI